MWSMLTCLAFLYNRVMDSRTKVWIIDVAHWSWMIIMLTGVFAAPAFIYGPNYSPLAAYICYYPTLTFLLSSVTGRTCPFLQLKIAAENGYKVRRPLKCRMLACILLPIAIGAILFSIF